MIAFFIQQQLSVNVDNNFEKILEMLFFQTNREMSSSKS